MTFRNSALARSALIAAAAVATLAATATAAQADVACNRWGDCWRVRDHLAYPAGVGVIYHDDAWAAAHPHGRWHLRADNFGRGYYRNGVWIAF